MLSITRKFSFSYAHRLPDYSGNCERMHGHNANLEIEVSGNELNGYPTMIIDFRKLKFAVENVLNDLDHKDLTTFFHRREKIEGSKKIEDKKIETVDYINIQLPATAETICDYIHNRVKAFLPQGVILQRVRVSETDDCYAEWRRD